MDEIEKCVKECIKKGTFTALKEAVALSDQLIEEFETQPMDPLEYRDDLASAYISRGNALADMGTPDSLQAAVSAYDEAIALQDELPIDNPEYRNDLAGVHMDRGLALRDMGTLDSLQDAVEAYNKAIALQNELPMDNPKYRNNLAMAYVNRGIALRDMGTLESLQAAVLAADEAIALQNELPMDNPKYRNDLAGVHMDRGNALAAMGMPDSLQYAVAAYDKAIVLRDELPMDNPEYRDSLARVHVNRGNALADIGTPDSLQAAVSAYDKAISLAEGLDINAISHSDLIAEAYREKAIGCLQIFHKEPESKKRKAYLETAGDSADDGLEILRNLEKAGCLVLRDLRESLFEICLDVYRRLNPRFVPEIVLEHLDPKEPGSSPESAAMHQTALYALVDLLRRPPLGTGAEERVGNDEIMEEIVDVIRYLLTIRTRYFAGTSAAARLQAGYYEMAGDSGRAREILESYRERRPKDPEGHLALADFQRRRTESAAAVVSYEQAAACLLNNLPETVSHEETEIAAESLSNLGDTVCHLILDDWPSLKIPGAVQHVNARYEQIWSWLARFEKIHEECLKGCLSDAMDELKARLRQEQQEWFERFEAAVQATAREDAASQLKEWVAGNENRWKARADAMLRTFCSGISVRWDSFVEALKAALGDLWDHYGPKWDEAHERSDAEEMARIEEEIAHGLSLALSREAARVSPLEKQVEYGIAEKSLGSIWQALAEDERQGLIAGLYCIGNDMVHQFAGLAFGQVVETALSNRVMWPLREELTKADHTLDIPTGKGPVIWAADFLNRKKNHLMLGQLVGIFNKALYSGSMGTDPDCDVLGLIHGHLNKLPSAGLLLTTDPEVQKRRKRALNFINEVRIRSAHPEEKTLSKDEAQTSWELLAVEPHVAFLHYFIGAHLEPDQKAAADSGET